LGVDGIVVARELDFTPQPASEWEAVLTTDEGRVFHRRGAPFARVRSISSIDSRPGEQFVIATVSRINNSRNRVEADIDVSNGNRPALLAFSRPYFRGYKAKMGNQKLVVTSYRGLFPTVEVPAGAHGRLALIYQPAWLILGSATTATCVLIILLAFILRGRTNNWLFAAPALALRRSPARGMLKLACAGGYVQACLSSLFLAWGNMLPIRGRFD